MCPFIIMDACYAKDARVCNKSYVIKPIDIHKKNQSIKQKRSLSPYSPYGSWHRHAGAVGISAICEHVQGVPPRVGNIIRILKNHILRIYGIVFLQLTYFGRKII